MGSLLLGNGLRESEEGSEERTLARARTLTVLQRLDPGRKTALIQFLEEAHLVQSVERRAPLITLSGANLSGADLSGSVLSDAGLSMAVGVRKEFLKQQAGSLFGAIMPDETFSFGKFEPAVSFEGGEGGDFAELAVAPDFLFIDGPKGGGLDFTKPIQVFDPSNPSEQKKLPAPESTEEWVSWFQRYPNL
jgi:hypothetical protein